MSIALSLLILSALIFFHELGHYLAARLMGVYVEVFSIGFGKKIFSFSKFNTTWSISAIPLGGYVKMKGQDDTDPTKISYDEDSYNTKTPLQRIFILVAGPLANFIMAFILYFFIALHGPMALSPIIGTVVKDSPAYQAGLKKDDIVYAINNHKISSWKEMAQFISTSTAPLDIIIKRDGLLEHKTLIPKLTQTKNIYGETIQRKMIGIGASGKTYQMDLGFFGALSYATTQTISASKMIFTGVQKLVMGDVPAKELGGVISIVQVTSDASKAGWVALFFFTALISVNLGVLNLLPIPALDGGHIMFNLYELITNKAPSQKVLLNLTMAGWVILFGLMGLGVYNDINRLIG
ncbi:Membrane-associated zinc metalloprotease [hydrothermal vent metagenome]|uniref:Membrane-associated zinc metalloprotease n=1 Tax=hydrothermal vent metagenome TaxID=652676 RepID=A0A1W1D2S3_9ZZZZ